MIVPWLVFGRSPLLDSKHDPNIVHAQVHTRSAMEILVEVGIREFREELASYLQESELPMGPLRATETGSVITFRRVVRGTKPTVWARCARSSRSRGTDGG
jgi:hypothetical protein